MFILLERAWQRLDCGIGWVSRGCSLHCPVPVVSIFFSLFHRLMKSHAQWSILADAFPSFLQDSLARCDVSQCLMDSCTVILIRFTSKKLPYKKVCKQFSRLPRSEIWDPGSIRKKLIPDSRSMGKKHRIPDTEHCLKSNYVKVIYRMHFLKHLSNLQKTAQNSEHVPTYLVYKSGSNLFFTTTRYMHVSPFCFL